MFRTSVSIAVGLKTWLGIKLILSIFEKHNPNTMISLQADEAKVKISEVSGERVDNKTKLDILKQEEESIRKEKEEEKRKKKEEEEKEKAAAEAEVVRNVYVHRIQNISPCSPTYFYYSL